MYLLVCFYIFVTALTFLFIAYVVYSVWKKITYMHEGRADLGTGRKSDTPRIRF